MIPLFSDESQNLPAGIHDCTIDEVELRFSAGEKRKRLCRVLREVHRIVKRCQFLELIVWGSFPTKKADPNDLDLLICTAPGINFESLHQDCRDLLNHQRAESRWGSTVFTCPQNADLYSYILDGLAYDRNKNPQGLLRIQLS